MITITNTVKVKHVVNASIKHDQPLNLIIRRREIHVNMFDVEQYMSGKNKSASAACPPPPFF